MIISVPLFIGPDREDALSEIVGFVLILALIVVASTLYLMYVVPAEGREDEIEHMNLVKDRFVSYKETLDALWLRSLTGIYSTGARGTTLSTSFDLGTGGGNTQSSGIFLSFMRPIGTAARMSVNTTGDRLTLFLDNVAEPNVNSVDLSALNYTTENYYWIQQVYSYEMGGVFLEQKGEGVSVKVMPDISTYRVVNGTRNATKLSLALLNLDGAATIGGTGPLRVETRLMETLNDTVRNQPFHNATIRIDARGEPWAEAWRQVFVETTRRSPLSSDDDTEYDPDPEKCGGAWFYIPTSIEDPDFVSTVAELQIRNRTMETGLNPQESRDLFLDLTRADYQVTFQYADL